MLNTLADSSYRSLLNFVVPKPFGRNRSICSRGVFEMHDYDVALRLQRWTAVSCLALIAATWRLWIPQMVFPQVPAFSILCTAPAWLDWICLGCLITGLGVLASGRSEKLNTSGCILVLGSLLVFFCLDQHRFQPWAYQLWLFTAIWLCCGVNYRLNWMSWLLVSIYFYSALGKLDFEFLHTVGQQMLGAMANLVGQESSGMSASLKLALVAIFPMIELAIAVGLAVPTSRRVAGVFAIGLHLTLIVILGPLGLNHRLGVLIWNAQFVGQAYFLFVAKRISVPDSGIAKREIAKLQLEPKIAGWLKGCLQTLCGALIALVIVMPSTERFGIWDHWPSWALYAPHSSRVVVEVAAPSVGRLPTELVALINRPAREADAMPVWVGIPMAAWSLQSLHTPIYPQSRFQLGVARQIASVVDSESEIRVTVLGTSDRFTGRRQSTILEGSSEISDAGGSYWYNTIPRRQK